ncbi:MAG TPA: 2-phospho-L-lactate guanylyltransferase [Chloroflexia bacterium]|nr:2-phospho-L-lactate guanylyltransferase [Chloroflexia bacterium]
MKTFAVIPVKGLNNAKSRLASVLSPQERGELVGEMLSHVLDALHTSGAIDNIAVINQLEGELTLPPFVSVIRQTEQGLNQLLEQGRAWAEAGGADALLVLFADLPLLLPDDIVDMVRQSESTHTIVVAPDRHGSGTNALLTHPVGLAQFAFGPGSFEAHMALAEATGAQVSVFHSAGTELDIDTLDDLARLDAYRIENAMQYAFS